MKKRKLMVHTALAVTSMMLVSCGSLENEQTKGTANTEASATIEAEATITPEETSEPTDSAVVTTTISPTVEPEQTTEQTEAPTSTPQEQEDTIKHLDAMNNVLTTIASYITEGNTYDSQHEECYYELLYLVGCNCGSVYGDTLCWSGDEGIYLNEKVLQELSVIAFAEQDAVESIPDEYQDLIRYDSNWGAYVLAGSDAPDVSGNITKSQKNEDGTYTIIFELINNEDSSVMDTYEFTLEDSKALSSNTDPIYYYSVKSAEKVTE